MPANSELSAFALVLAFAKAPACAKATALQVGAARRRDSLHFLVARRAEARQRGEGWWRRTGSNRRPWGYESHALTI